MLALSDVPIDRFIPYFASAGVPVAFLVPTPTGYKKSIMDATIPVRQFLLEENVHNYETQRQGPENKVVIPAYFVNYNNLTKTSASLYRPVTKKGDPRIWFSHLCQYCQPCNLLALIIIKKEIYVFNLSKPEVATGLQYHGFAYSILEEASLQKSCIANELLEKLRAIHRQGFLPSITSGDPGVGDTLENALGINRNNSRFPDYKGIELKSTRLTRNGTTRATTRSTLFTKVPDGGMTYREIVSTYGKWQIPRGYTVPRLQLYETLRCSRPNAYGLLLGVNTNDGILNILYQDAQSRKYVSSWRISNLCETLLLKHHETFWIKAISEYHDGREYFRYDKVLHTKNPNTSLFAPLLQTDKITVDLAAHFKPDGKWRDHGILFKMMPEDLPLLLGEPVEYIL